MLKPLDSLSVEEIQFNTLGILLKDSLQRTVSKITWAA